MASNYHVDADSVGEVYTNISNNVTSWQTSLQSTNGSIQNIAGCVVISGGAADNIRNYFGTIHTSIIAIFDSLLMAHSMGLLTYKNAYFEIDSNIHHILDVSELDRLNNELQDLFTQKYDLLNTDVQGAIDSVSDLVSVVRPDFDAVFSAYEAIKKQIDDLIEAIGETEDQYYSSSFTETYALIQQLKTFIAERLGDDRSYKEQFTKAALLSSPSLSALQNSYINVQAYIQNNKDAYIKAIDAEKERVEVLSEERAKREKKAKWMKVGLKVVVIGAGALIAGCFTGGVGAAVVIGAAKGILSAGGEEAINQYVEHGWDTQKWDTKKIGSSAAIGGISGAVAGALSEVSGGGAKDWIMKGKLGEAITGKTADVVGSVIKAGVGGIPKRAADSLVKDLLQQRIPSMYSKKSFPKVLTDAGSKAFNPVDIGFDMAGGVVKGFMSSGDSSASADSTGTNNSFYDPAEVLKSFSSGLVKDSHKIRSAILSKPDESVQDTSPVYASSTYPSIFDGFAQT